MKPTDFFVGVMELFAILLPGALFTFALRGAAEGNVFGRALPGLGWSVAERWAVFLVASYILGHLLHAAGEILDYTVYDKCYVPRRERKYQAVHEKYEAALNKKASAEKAETAEAAEAAKEVADLKEALDRDGPPLSQVIKEVEAWKLKPSGVNLFRYAGSFVRARSAQAAAELDRGGADSKFFRSLALLVPLLLVGGYWRVFSDEKSVHYAIAMGLLGVALFVFSAWRFCSLRWTNTQLTYEYFLILVRPPQATEARVD